MKKILHLAFYIPNRLSLLLNRVKHKDFIFFGWVLIKNDGKLVLGEKLRVNSSRLANVIGGDTRTTFVVKKGAFLSIGNGVSISNAAIYCAEKIIIDDYVMIGGSCKIWDSDFHPLDPLQRKIAPNDNYSTRPIHIGESAFIGGGSIVLKGVTIGRNSIVGAGSVVVSDIPENEIWGGNPARFIKKVNING